MNKQRRADIEKARALIEEATALIRDAADGEQEYFDNMPEGLQQGDKGQQAETTANGLSELADALEAAEWDDWLQ